MRNPGFSFWIPAFAGMTKADIITQLSLVSLTLRIFVIITQRNLMVKTSVTKESILLGNFSQEELDHIMRKASTIEDIAERIDFISRYFLGLNYGESTLIGAIKIPEVLVINLQGVDCFTYIDYVEAMRLSNSFSAFKVNLRKVRYKSGIVVYENRNHFFTDWREWNSESIDDITEEIGFQKAIKIQKLLNEKEDGTYFLPGVHPVKREFSYIPSDAVDDLILHKLRTGDYVGIYSEVQGLDVSHVGIIIKDRDDIYLRHASSLKEYRKVVDQDFRKYIVEKPGLIVLRPKMPD